MLILYVLSYSTVKNHFNIAIGVCLHVLLELLQFYLITVTLLLNMQRLASDFLSNYIFLSVGRVGSSTELIDQRVELVPDMDKRSRLMNILKDQRTNGMDSKVLVEHLWIANVETNNMLWLTNVLMFCFHAACFDISFCGDKKRCRCA